MQKPYPEIIDDISHIAEDPEVRYTIKDYMNWQFDEMVELIRGKVFRMSPAPSTYHQMISANLTREISTYFKNRQCLVFVAPTDIYLPISDSKGRPNTVVQPDLLIVCDKNKIKPNGIYGAPDLIIEIISQHTSKKDLKLKYEVYQESKVKEYWTIYPKDHILHIFTLDEKTEYVLQGIYTQDDVVCPVLFPELIINLRDIFQEI